MEGFVIFEENAGYLSQSKRAKFKGVPFYGYCKKEMEFINVNQWILYNKSLLFNDTKMAEHIMTLDVQDMVKYMRLYGAIENSSDRKLWNNHKKIIVREGNMLKFEQNDAARKELLSTGNKTIGFATEYDTEWGIGLSIYDKGKFDRRMWRGKNVLGKILIDIRKELNELV